MRKRFCVVPALPLAAAVYLAAVISIFVPVAHADSCVTPSGYALSVTAPGITPGPVDPVKPPPPVDPVKPPPASSACAAATDPKFVRAMAEVPLPHIETLTFWRMNRGLTSDELACARERGVPGMAPPTPTVDVGNPQPNNIDRRQLRDLSILNGPAIIEGYAGHVDYITLRRPVGSLIEITMGRTTSGLGAIMGAKISANGAVEFCGGSDCYGKIRFLSTGDDVVRVELLTPGALAVQRN